MKRKSAILFLICMMLVVSAAAQAFAAGSLKGQYQYTVSQQSGTVEEELPGDVFEEWKPGVYQFILVPQGGKLTFTTKADISASVMYYVKNEEGMLEGAPYYWESNGDTEDITTYVQANTAAAVTLKHAGYYVLDVSDPNGEEGLLESVYFKVGDEEAPAGGAAVSSDRPDAWAEAPIAEAIDEGLVPESLQSKYAATITRADFCSLVVKLVEAQLGMPIADVLAEKQPAEEGNPFTDTASPDVLAANRLGIVSGKGGGLFDPNGSITRQEAAVMLANTAKALGSETAGSGAAFADASEIADWAKAAVGFVSSRSVMNGVDDNRFAPKESYTRQQAIVTALRLLRAL